MSRKFLKYLGAVVGLMMTTLTVAQNPLSTSPIQAAEYFLDIDPGPGNGIAIPVASPLDTIGVTEVTVLSTISDTLSGGNHVLGLRVQDTTGMWSYTRLASFLVDTISSNGSGNSPLETSPIVAAEYFLDNDPGPGNGIAISLSGIVDTIGLTEVALPTSISDTISGGNHVIGVRVKDTTGVWSYTRLASFLVDTISSVSSDLSPLETSPIVAAEYFIDIDPGPGNGFAIPVAGPVDTIGITEVTVLTSITDTLSGGNHVLGVRVRDTTGVWSFVRLATFLVDTISTDLGAEEDTRIVGYEYFFADTTDVGPGNGTYVSLGDTVETMEGVEINLPATPALSAGEHYFNVRLKYVDGWSFLHSSPFDVCLNPLDTPTYAIGNTLCDGPDNTDLKAFGSPTGEYVWYDVSSGGTPIKEELDTLYENYYASESTTLYVATKGTLCNSNRIPVQVDVLNGLSVPIAESVLHCGPGDFTISPTGKPAGGTYNWYSGPHDSLLIQTSDVLDLSLDSTTTIYFKGATLNQICQSDFGNTIIAIKSCLPTFIEFAAPNDAIFNITAPQALTAFSKDENGDPTGLPVYYEIIDGGGVRAFIRNDSVFYIGIGVVRIRAYSPGDEQFIYQGADDVVVSFTIAADAAEVAIENNSPVCAATTLTLAATVITDGVYEWTTPTGNLVNSRVLTVFPVSEADTGRYNLKVVTPNDTLRSSAVVEVLPEAADVKLEVVQVSECEDRSFEMTVVGGDFDTFDWLLNGSALLQTTDSLYVPSFTGVYSAVATDSNNCSNSTAPEYLDLTPDDVPEIAYDTNGFLYTTQTFDDYQWYVEEYFIVDANAQQLTLLASGSYKVAGTTAEGCVYYSNAFQIVDGSLPTVKTYLSGGTVDYTRSSDLTVFPSPVDGTSFTVSSKNKLGKVQIVSISGEVLFTSDLTAEGIKSLLLDQLNLQNGVYVLTNNYHSNYEQLIFTISK